MREELIELGLTNNEVTVYLTLSKYKELSAYSIATKTGIDRSVTYNLLSSLVLKGLITSLEKNGKKFFFITDPKNLLLDLKLKQDMAKRIIKEMKKRRENLEEKEEYVKIYEGKMGSKKFYDIIANTDSDKVYTYGGSGKSIEMYKSFWPYFQKIFTKQFKQVKAILPVGYKNIDKADFFEMLDVKLTKKLLNVSFTIIDDTTAFHTYEDNPKVVLIKNKDIAELMKDAFEKAWEGCEPISDRPRLKVSLKQKV